MNLNNDVEPVDNSDMINEIIADLKETRKGVLKNAEEYHDDNKMYNFYSGRSSGLAEAIEVLKKSRLYKPPEQVKDDSVLTDAYGLSRLYQGGWNEND